MKIYIKNHELEVDGTPSLSLLNNFLVNGSPIHTVCGGKAICGCCRIKIIAGQKFMSKPNKFEQAKLGDTLLKEGWRLSCQSYALRDIEIFMPKAEDLEDLCSRKQKMTIWHKKF